MNFLKNIFTALQPTPFKIGCLIIAISCLIFYSFGGKKPALIETFDNQIVDAMFRLRGSQETTKSVSIVDIDERSLSKIGQWPWPRNVVAELIQKIHDHGAKAIGLDIVFAENDRTSPKNSLFTLHEILSERFSLQELSDLTENSAFDYDVILGDVIAETPTVLGYVFQTIDDNLKNETEKPFPSINLSLSPPDLQYKDLTLLSAYRAILNVPDISMAQTEGFFNVFPDPSGTVRKVPMFIELDGVPYPSLGLEMLRIGLDTPQVTLHASRQKKGKKFSFLGMTLKDNFISTDDMGQVTVNFRGPMKSFPYIPAIDILQGTIPAHTFKDQYVLIGTSAAGLLDLRATPYSNVYPGVEVHANLIDNILKGDPFTHDIFTEIGLTYTVIIVGGLLIAALLSYSSPLIGGFGGLFLIITCLFYGNYSLFFLNNQLIGLTYQLLSIFNVFFFVTLFNFFFKDREKRFIQSAFGHYVSPDVVNQLIHTPDKLSLKGEEKKLTIFFNDIRGFTSISERMTSQQLGIFMNEYLTAMSDVIMEHGGTVDKYIGDAIMALWGAPLDDEKQAENAVRASLCMLGKLEELKPVWQKKGLPAIDIGIGLNTGIVSVGNFGSAQRFDYTVLGDSVNLASRLEGLNKMYGTNILISESTKDELQDLYFCRFVDMVRVKGKKEPVTIYQPLSEGTPDSLLENQVVSYHEAISLYRSRQFTEAQKIFAELNDTNSDKLFELYLERIKLFADNPPPEDWDGVFSATTK